MRQWIGVMLAVLILVMSGGCNGGSGSSGRSMASLAQEITSGATAENALGRILIIDTRPSSDYLSGHIKDALCVPYELIQDGGQPLYTNGYDAVAVDASEQLADSWFTHLIVNQLVNDFSSTYKNSTIIFYGDNGKKAAELAEKIGYTDIDWLGAAYADWASTYPDLSSLYAPGVVSVDESEKSFIFTGSINTDNYDNVSSWGTHHGIVYKGGGLNFYSLIQADIPPFLFQETLTRLGADPGGNMADGIYYGSSEEYGVKHTSGQQVEFLISWEGADRYYTLSELFTEQPGQYDPDPDGFAALGLEARIGGSRDSNLNWNPGCIFCCYSCVCGITSNSKANDNDWFDDGGIYEPLTDPDNPQNYYAGRYFPRADLLPTAGETILIKAVIVE